MIEVAMLIMITGVAVVCGGMMYDLKKTVVFTWRDWAVTLLRELIFLCLDVFVIIKWAGY